MTAGDWEGSSKARGPKVTYAKVRRRKLKTMETKRRVKMEGTDSFPANLLPHPLVLLSSLHLHPISPLLSSSYLLSQEIFL